MAVRFVKPIQTEYESQFVPMPLDFMYKNMQEKQKGLDLTREANAKAALALEGAPFAEDRGEVLAIKQNFQSDVNKLAQRLEKDKESYGAIMSELTGLNQKYNLEPFVNKIRKQKEAWDANVAPAIKKHGAKNVWIPGAEVLNPNTNQWEWKPTEDIDVSDLDSVIVDDHINYINTNFASKLKESVKETLGGDTKIEIVDVTDPTTGLVTKQLKTTKGGSTTITDLNLDNDFTVDAIDKATNLILNSQDNDSEYIKNRLWNPNKNNGKGGWGYDNAEDLKTLVGDVFGIGYYKKEQITPGSTEFKNVPGDGVSSSSTGVTNVPGPEIATVQPYTLTSVPIQNLETLNTNISALDQTINAAKGQRFDAAVATISTVAGPDVKKEAAKGLINANNNMTPEMKKRALSYIDQGVVTYDNLLAPNSPYAGYLAGVDKTKAVSNMDVQMHEYADALATMTPEQIAADPDYSKKVAGLNNYFTAKREETVAEAQSNSYKAIRNKIYEGAEKEIKPAYQKKVEEFNKKYKTGLNIDNLIDVFNGEDIRKYLPADIGDETIFAFGNIVSDYKKEFDEKAKGIKAEEVVQALATTGTPTEKESLGKANQFLKDNLSKFNISALGLALGIDVTGRGPGEISTDLIKKYGIFKSAGISDGDLAEGDVKLTSAQISYDPNNTIPTAVLTYSKQNEGGVPQDIILNVPLSTYGETSGLANVVRQNLDKMIVNTNPEVQAMGYQLYARTEIDPQELALMYSLQNSTIDNAAVTVGVGNQKFVYEKATTEAPNGKKITSFFLVDGTNPSNRIPIAENNVTGAITQMGTIALNRKIAQISGGPGGATVGKSPIPQGQTWSPR